MRAKFAAYAVGVTLLLGSLPIAAHHSFDAEYDRTKSRNFEGQVTAIAPIATKPAEWQLERTVLVTTRLDNSAGVLKSEMTGNAKIYGDRQRLISLIGRRLVRFIRVEFWSWW